MILFILSYLGGALTILAPCILPVLPFVFARIDQPFVKSGLPLLAGMALTFAGVGTLGAVAGDWAVQANEYGRIVAIVLLATMGLALVAPRIAERVTRPLVTMGSRLSNAAMQRTDKGANPTGPSFLLGIATGLLWAPCAGPVLGLVLTGAAIEGPSVRTSLLLLAYAAGAVTSLALVLLAGGRVFAAMKRSLGIGEWFRKGLGFAVLAGVTAIALGLDTGVLAQLSLGGGSTTMEKNLIERLRPQRAAQAPAAVLQAATLDRRGFMTVRSDSVTVAKLPPLPVQGSMPPLSGAVEWLNSTPLTAEALRGKVVLVDFWTFGCVNCLNALPHVREWHRKYKDQGLVVVGVHSPEFAFEKNINNVKNAVNRLDISFPVAIDNNFAIWRAFSNNYWPAHYFVDAKGRIRFHHFGEGEYEKSEQVIQQLLEEARKEAKPV
ncbi:cytochrome c biogenesis protein DipZ [Polaromonas sp. JS666]|uniref:cytochrome c biogenesis protein DipZ n=1 Tax=Polaromonas sp. (strain JS666 / ATCC BAA-500) TaxID=296591 RepID=UPI0000464F23|nr:cytochrome c biogenesis protein DipZ [Polaromonas sp. JS666]ABE42499.1 cytochrome c biogenesis protein, transmembrane region [Polaromonas sp. JS666]